ncbi:nucleoplasmin-like protein [Sitodiplosis mosellana]|uniref:nucleoplasmin-like protein n=1 Tax=Sitodiplosis mosellana TaxID=263140 RepID=UPI0024452ACF|nr:nucleoplasmin-like protein [Sitodiplosis mosellana]
MKGVVKSEEYFYGATLDKKGASITWDSKAESEESLNADRLHLRQILLGHTAKENEYNVVEVETLSANETVKIPIAVLKVGESRVVQPELEFPYGPVTFTLVEGSGPVYIHGQQVPNGYEDQVIEGGEDYDSDEEGLEENDFEEDAEELPPSKKPKLATNKSNKKK